MERRFTRLRFGLYEIDLDAGELRKNGGKASLQEQPFQVLALLLTRSGQLVTRDELQKRLWPADTFVDFDLGLNTAIKKIRSALGDSADNPRFVETLPKRGYRFICPVEEVRAAAPETSPADKSVAEATPVAETTAIPQNRETIQASAGSRAWFWLVAGSVAAITLAAGLGFYLLHQRTAHRRPTVEEVERSGDRGTSDNTAYAFYKEGRRLLQSEDAAEKSDGAIQAFQQAIETDRKYSLAYSGLGQAYTKKYELTRQEQWKDEAQKACNYAVELDAGRADGHICLGVLDNSIGLYKQAIKDFSAGIEIDPLSARAYQGRARAYKGLDKVAEAEKDYLKAIELDPRNWRSHSALAKLYFDNSRYDEAAPIYEAAIRLKPDDSGLHSSLGASYLQMGQYDRAVPELEHAIELQATFQDYENLGLSFLNKGRFPEAINRFQAAIALDDPQMYLGYGALARAYFWAGQRELARKNYERAIALAEQKLIVNPDDADVHLMLSVYYAMLRQEKDAHSHLDRAQQLMPDEPEVDFWAGVVHLQLGNRARALAWLRQARSLKYSSAEMKAAPELDSLRADPEFRQFMSAGGNSVPAGIDPELTRRAK